MMWPQMRRVFSMCLVIVVVSGLQMFAGPTGVDTDADELRTRSVEILRRALTEEAGWTRAHAAEMLVYHSYFDRVREVFEAEQARQPGPGDRIGVWSVLAQAAANDQVTRREYMDRILAAALDEDAADRLDAVEALGRLGYSEANPRLAAFARDAGGVLQVHARLVLANSGEPEGEARLADLLTADEVEVRAAAACALRRLPTLRETTFDRLAAALSSEARDTPARVSLLSALYAHSAEGSRAETRHRAGTELLPFLQTGGTDAKRKICSALAAAGGREDRAALAALLNDSDAGVRCHAANALLRIQRRQYRGLQWPDWAVIIGYALFMVGVGVFYSRRQTSTEEYFLASRNMSSLLVGVSIFATLLSTISYLAIPGELIKHGPVVLSGVLALPVVHFFVGWFLIPRVMNLKITSAYELLEERLGIQVRVVGAVIFIVTRLVWMALLIYIAAKLMVEMLNWSDAMVPWVVLAAGMIAVLYTALGGLRAVIVTDLYQFVILTVGAIVAIGLISMQMGGFDWFPTAWAPHWDKQPLFSKNIATRATVVGALINTFFWWICTAGSDQVAIQRYLATRDVKAARKAFLINLIANAVILVLLALVGFALLGFFRANPHLLSDGKGLISDADYLFPRFIADYLPVGFAGLVVAGMFAAAMSSLDSGINSIVTVFCRDFLDRFRRAREGEQAGAVNVKVAKYLVLAIGLTVVLLSSQVGEVPGNITEVTNKTNGLFVGPLFGLFFMALFVRRATTFGTIIGAVYGFMTAVMFAYWDAITGAAGSLSFQYITPVGIVVHVIVGLILSRLPTRGKSAARIAGWSVVALLPLVVLYVCLFKWGLVIAKALNWGVAG